jgi:hypothetical protein
VCVARQHIAEPVLDTGEPLRVEYDARFQEKSCEVPRRFELKRVTELGEI